MTSPTLSVITANYNHAHLIGEALDAILRQSLRPLELIVVDDGSTDNSVEVIERFARRDTTIRLVRNERNMGAQLTSNRGLQHASGAYMYFAAADDRILPGFFEKSIALLTQYPQAGLCCSDPAWFEDSTKVVRVNSPGWSTRSCYFSPDELAAHLKGGYIYGHTSVPKLSAMLEAGGLVKGLNWYSDWFAYLVIGFRYGVCYIPEPLAALRALSTSYSAAGASQWRARREVLNYMLYLLKSPAYRDVLPLFKRSCALAPFGLRMLRVILSNPDHRDYLSPPLIRHALWNQFANAAYQNAARIAPSSAKRLYRYIRYRRRANRTIEEWS